MDPNLPTGETMSEGSDIAPAAADGEQVEIPSSLVDAYPNVGDSITLRVIATDPESGIITVGRVSAPEAESEVEAEGSDAMAAEFDEAETPNTI